MDKIMKDRGIKYSIILHVVVFIILCFGFPSFDHDINKDVVVSVEIAPLSELSNLQNYTVSEKKKELEPTKSEEVKPQAKSEKSIDVDNKLTEKKSEAKKDNKTIKEEDYLKPKKPVSKKDSKEMDKSKKTKKKSSDQKTKNELDSMLKNLEEESIKNDNEKVKKPNKQSNTSDNKSMSNRQFDETMPLSMSEKDAIKAQIERRFSNPVAMQFNPGELVVHIRFILNADGTVRDVTLLSSSIYPARYANAYQSISEGLIRAAYSASPLQGISRGDEIILTFDAYYLMND
jgi:hypothetical protein